MALEQVATYSATVNISDGSEVVGTRTWKGLNAEPTEQTTDIEDVAAKANAFCGLLTNIPGVGGVGLKTVSKTARWISG